MSYSSIQALATDGSLMGRINAAAATQGLENPDSWVAQRMWKFASQPTWGDKWAYAVDNATVNVNPDTGIRTDVISDGDILAAVQAIIAEEAE